MATRCQRRIPYQFPHLRGQGCLFCKRFPDTVRLLLVIQPWGSFVKNISACHGDSGNCQALQKTTATDAETRRTVIPSSTGRHAAVPLASGYDGWYAPARIRLLQIVIFCCLHTLRIKSGLFCSGFPCCFPNRLQCSSEVVNHFWGKGGPQGVQHGQDVDHFLGNGPADRA